MSSACTCAADTESGKVNGNRNIPATTDWILAMGGG